MRYLKPCEVAQVVQVGSSVRLVARRFGVSPSVIFRAWRRFRDTGQCSRIAGQGRRRATIHQQDRYLVLSARRFRRSTARSLQSDLKHGTEVQISDQTVRNQLHSSELRFWRPFVGLILTPCHCAAQRAFVREYQIWQVSGLVSYAFHRSSSSSLCTSPGGRGAEAIFLASCTGLFGFRLFWCCCYFVFCYVIELVHDVLDVGCCCPEFVRVVGEYFFVVYLVLTY